MNAKEFDQETAIISTDINDEICTRRLKQLTHAYIFSVLRIALHSSNEKGRPNSKEKVSVGRSHGARALP